jgi:hypothetical protein
MSLAHIGRNMRGTAKHQIEHCFRFNRAATKGMETVDAMRDI